MMTRRSTARCIVALVLLVLTLFLAPSPIAHAATLYVTTLADSGVGSLRAALTTAGDNDTIRFSVSGTILLASSLPHVTQNPLTIDGQGQTVRIDGQNAHRLFYVDINKALHLKNLEVAHGFYGTGGALNVDGNYSVSGTTVDNVTFVGNTAPSGYGGAIWNGSGSLTVTNSTFSGNSAGVRGGALYNANGWEIDVMNSTFYGNSSPAGAVAYNNSGFIRFKNTILANSVTGSSCSGTIADNGYNLEDGTSCGFSVANHSLSSTYPQLGPLAANGGPTRTMALLAGSPALDKIPDGTNGCGTTVTTDQRGMPRPQGTLCDMGAFEVGLPHSIVITGGDLQKAYVNHAFGATLDVKVTDALALPFAGAVVTYTGPASGAGIAGGGTQTTNASGNASRSVTANGIVGGPYAVTATVSGVTPATFHLVNVPYLLYLPLVLR